jgi:hypothetical protein
MRARGIVAVAALLVLASYRISTRAPVYAQQAPAKAASAQKLDEDYTARIKKATPDPRIITEYVDHMPASATVPSPLKFFGYVPGEPGHLTYHADIVRYYEALEKASPRVKLFRIGKSEEGRDMVALAIADEPTIKQLDKYKDITAKLTDPRAPRCQAKQLIAAGKPSTTRAAASHAGNRQPRMLTGSRSARCRGDAVHQTITQRIVSPNRRVDGREKRRQFPFREEPGQAAPGLVAGASKSRHATTDGIGVGPASHAEHPKGFPDWHPRCLRSTNRCTYASRPAPARTTPSSIIQIKVVAARAERMMEMAKRNVLASGVRCHDGWVPNMFWIGVTHNRSAASTRRRASGDELQGPPGRRRPTRTTSLGPRITCRRRDRSR